MTGLEAMLIGALGVALLGSVMRVLRRAQERGVTLFDTANVYLDSEEKIGRAFQVDELLAHRHFGLAGMAVRSTLIGAQVQINSAPNEGTRIYIIWRDK